MSDATNSQALSFAVKAGLKPQLAYTVSDTAKYLGVSEGTLRTEHKAGRLKFIMPNGMMRGMRIAVTEVDRWIKENTE